jgi:PhzF family phenazine biosynthesis protein
MILEKQYTTTNLHFPVYHVNAFTRQLFSGNPAMVCLLPYWPTDVMLHAIAREHNLPVTVFLVRDAEQFSIRWITPEEELDLCGHGSLAAGHVIFNYIEPSLQTVHFSISFGTISNNAYR